MGKDKNSFRVFIIGAGFSVPAGLPTAAKLYNEVRTRIERNHGTDTKFHCSLNEYIKYRKKSDGIEVNIDSIDLEHFMSFLDIEHFLWLEGSDTFSEHGNSAQLFIKRYIGQVIHECTPAIDKLPDEYYEFAKQLQPTDLVITLNYDVILERALEHVGKAYRLFPYRFSSVGKYSNRIDDSVEEIRVLKLHGSLDWFSNKQYLSGLDAFKKQGVDGKPTDPIFNSGNRYGAYPLVDGERCTEDPLNHVYRLTHIDSFYKNASPPGVPLILSPSYMKIVYATPFMDFWNGLGQVGGMHLGLNVIGFSLPDHDDYLKVTLFKMAQNYQELNWDMEMLDKLKDNIKVIDYRIDDDGKNELRGRYKFFDDDKSSFFYNGFSPEAVDFIFTPQRKGRRCD